jgi:hypothetical protein
VVHQHHGEEPDFEASKLTDRQHHRQHPLHHHQHQKYFKSYKNLQGRMRAKTARCCCKQTIGLYSLSSLKSLQQLCCCCRCCFCSHDHAGAQDPAAGADGGGGGSPPPSPPPQQQIPPQLPLQDKKVPKKKVLSTKGLGFRFD